MHPMQLSSKELGYTRNNVVRFCGPEIYVKNNSQPLSPHVKAYFYTANGLQPSMQKQQFEALTPFDNFVLSLKAKEAILTISFPFRFRRYDSRKMF
jgi:hypothetical protein